MVNPFHDAEELDEFITRPTPRVIDTLSTAPEHFAVLGAGGKMGYHVTRMLSRALQAAGRSDRIYAVSRFGDEAARQRFEESGVETISADLTERSEVDGLPDAGNVIFLAGIKFGTSNDPDLLQRFNILMPALVAERFRASRITALSTGNVYSYVHNESGGATEKDPAEPVGEYGKSCLGREQAFVNASQKFGTPCCILRLNYSVALRYGVPTDIGVKIRTGQPVDLEMGYVNLIWQGDAVDHILQSLSHATSPAQILNITGRETISVRWLAEQFARRFNVTPQFSGAEAENALLSNASRSHELFGSPRVRVNDIVDWTAAWIEADQELLNKPTHFETRSGAF
ncbi:NAD-dependent epimerase/dehydratase family protein [Rubinisphaera margarita]|uniref:NAD-dependent epimerase/dehydratase family protein n=1 Tax=Rubinisphaera margarita TaxID=2909586 RepID=UPI001EE94F2F|nr:NAD(P)-dependent oxidoreductase [Rubinisphaera margarita]MCG6156254.1 NAD(P)-dependent oxidoreductase [Rubinisphaera margarita]